jgi:hypothetical protein
VCWLTCRVGRDPQADVYYLLARPCSDAPRLQFHTGMPSVAAAAAAPPAASNRSGTGIDVTCSEAAGVAVRRQLHAHTRSSGGGGDRSECTGLTSIARTKATTSFEGLVRSPSYKSAANADSGVRTCEIQLVGMIGSRAGRGHHTAASTALMPALGQPIMSPQAVGRHKRRLYTGPPDGRLQRVRKFKEQQQEGAAGARAVGAAPTGIDEADGGIPTAAAPAVASTTGRGVVSSASGSTSSAAWPTMSPARPASSDSSTLLLARLGLHAHAAAFQREGMQSVSLLARMAADDPAHLRVCMERTLGIEKLGQREAIMLELPGARG